MLEAQQSLATHHEQLAILTKRHFAKAQSELLALRESNMVLLNNVDHRNVDLPIPKDRDGMRQSLSGPCPQTKRSSISGAVTGSCTSLVATPLASAASTFGWSPTLLGRCHKGHEQSSDSGSQHLSVVPDGKPVSHRLSAVGECGEEKEESLPGTVFENLAGTSQIALPVPDLNKNGHWCVADTSSCESHVELASVWKDVGHSKVFRGSMMSLATLDNYFDFAEREDEKHPQTSKHPGRCIMHPSSTKRSCWDIASLFLVFYDMVTIPLGILEIPATDFSQMMAWSTRIFWTSDLPVTFATGLIMPDGSANLCTIDVAWNYARGWLCLDVFIVAVDWVELFWTSGQSLRYARVSKFSRIFRMLRMIRLLRLVRVTRVLTHMAERVLSERMVIIADMAKMIVILLVLAHLFGCVWCGIGAWSDPAAGSWLRSHNMDEQSLGYRYASALHWSLMQFGGGTDEITAQNMSERVYAICIFIFAFVLSVALMSKLTSSMTRLHLISSKQAEQLSILRRYLQNNGVSRRLAVRAFHNVHHVLMQRQRFMSESQVELLAVISTPLQTEIHFEMYSTVLCVHPFFARYVSECPQVLRRICHHAMTTLLASRGDTIFTAGEIPANPKMNIICGGQLQFISIEGRTVCLGEKRWISEACLWVESWMHRGVLVATSDCRLCVLDAHSFQDIASRFEHPAFHPSAYAKEFVSALNGSGASEFSDVPSCLHEPVQPAMSGELPRWERTPAMKSDVSRERAKAQGFVDAAVRTGQTQRAVRRGQRPIGSGRPSILAAISGSVRQSVRPSVQFPEASSGRSSRRVTTLLGFGSTAVQADAAAADAKMREAAPRSP